MTDCTNAVYVENDTELSLLIGPSVICDENQTGNDVIDYIGVVYTETETEMLGPIRPSDVCDENQTGK